MSSFSIAYRGVKAVVLLAGATLICGFTFREGGPPEDHYADYNAKPPLGNTVSVCHAHGCQKQVSFTFTGDDISDLSVLMDYARNTDTAPEERRAIAYAIAWMERRVGPSTGTANDRASLGFMNASGQLDCVDEATNATSYLLVLQNNGLLRHHTVIRPFSKASFFKWPHMAAMIRTRSNSQVYAVDSGVGPNGANPAITLASKWYISEWGASPAPVPVPARPLAPVPAQPQIRSQDSDNIGQLVQQIIQYETTNSRLPMMAGYDARRIR
jgi:hypothetical protein